MGAVALPAPSHADGTDVGADDASADDNDLRFANELDVQVMENRPFYGQACCLQEEVFECEAARGRQSRCRPSGPLSRF